MQARQNGFLDWRQGKHRRFWVVNRQVWLFRHLPDDGNISGKNGRNNNPNGIAAHESLEPAQAVEHGVGQQNDAANREAKPGEASHGG